MARILFDPESPKTGKIFRSSAPAEGAQPGAAQISPMFEDEALRLFASQHSGAGAKALRQAYGIYKLITAPREALRLGAARADRSLGRLIAGAGRKRALASQPFICSKWSCAMRLRRMIDHCAIVDELGHPFTIDRSHYIEILTFELDGEPCRLMLDQPGWLASDGLLCVAVAGCGAGVFHILLPLDQPIRPDRLCWGNSGAAQRRRA